jgi:hypothetical protein
MVFSRSLCGAVIPALLLSMVSSFRTLKRYHSQYFRFHQFGSASNRAYVNRRAPHGPVGSLKSVSRSCSRVWGRVSFGHPKLTNHWGSAEDRCCTTLNTLPRAEVAAILPKNATVPPRRSLDQNCDAIGGSLNMAPRWLRPTSWSEWATGIS